jgi:ubiquinone/menaquinone biosynthesis C-methylase UbiE
MAGYIHGETSPEEVARLEKQARFAARWLLEGVEAGPGARVLDLPVGTGAMARRLRARLPDVQLFGADLSRGQLKAARAFMRTPDERFPLVNANAAYLPFRDGTFDLVNSDWFLEHVPTQSVVPILREVRRVLSPGASLWLCEVDNDSLSFWPRLPLAERCFDALWEAQARSGGDPIVGRKLYGFLMRAGFSRATIFPTTMHTHAGSPAGLFRGSLVEFAEILVGAQAALPPDLRPRAAEAARTLLDLEHTEGASFTYSFFRARADR